MISLFRPFMLLMALAGSPGAGTPQPSCKTFSDCLRQTLASQEPLAKSMLASQAIQLYQPTIPKRDLYNLLMLRSDALLQLYLSSPDARLLEQAESDDRRMLEMRPGDFLPQLGLARIAELRGQAELAEQLYAKASNPHHPESLLSVAEYQLRRRNPALAMAALDQALQLFNQMLTDKQDVYPQHLLRLQQLRAQVLRLLQRDAEADEALRAACSAGDRGACKDLYRRRHWSFF